MAKDLFLEMLKLQDGFNEKTVPGWTGKSLDWGTTILTEGAECSSSVNFKWWKADTDDWENVEVETIDLHHFIMSILLETYSAEHLANIYDYIYEQRVFDEDDIPVTEFHAVVKHLIYHGLAYDLGRNEEAMYALINSFFNLLFNFTSIDTVDELHTLYITKNCLNKFRQDNGYKDGTYKKMWISSEKDLEVEDNVIAWELASQLDNTNKFDNLYKELKKYYHNM